MSLTIIVGAPGAGKSKAIRDRYLKAKGTAIFFDCHHTPEIVRQLRHEMGYFDHKYLSCSSENLWPELAKLDNACEVFIDLPDMTTADLERIRHMADEKGGHFTVTAREIPATVEAEIIAL